MSWNLEQRYVTGRNCLKMVLFTMNMVEVERVPVNQLRVSWLIVLYKRNDRMSSGFCEQKVFRNSETLYFPRRKASWWHDSLCCGYYGDDGQWYDESGGWDQGQGGYQEGYDNVCLDCRRPEIDYLRLRCGVPGLRHESRIQFGRSFQLRGEVCLAQRVLFWYRCAMQEVSCSLLSLMTFQSKWTYIKTTRQQWRKVNRTLVSPYNPKLNSIPRSVGESVRKCRWNTTMLSEHHNEHHSPNHFSLKKNLSH